MCLRVNTRGGVGALWPEYNKLALTDKLTSSSIRKRSDVDWTNHPYGTLNSLFHLITPALISLDKNILILVFEI